MQTIDEMRKHCRVAVAAAAVVVVAGTGLAGDIVKELFPWFEIGETVDVAKTKGLKHLHDFAATPDLRARAEYCIKDTGLPTNHAAWVELSLPDRKVLQIRHDIDCATTNEAAALSAELIAKFKMHEDKSGGKVVEVCPTSSKTTVCTILSAADYAREFHAWYKKVDSDD